MIVCEICCMRNSTPKFPRIEEQLLSETMNQEGFIRSIIGGAR